MTTIPFPLRRLGALAASLGLVAAIGACSSSKSSSGAGPVTVSITPVLDADCADATGDVAVPAIDIVSASVHPKGDDLAMTFTTAGPIAQATDPLFSVSHGDPSVQPAASFEVRAELDSGGVWGVTLITFPTSANVQEQRRTLPSGKVTIEGTSATITVPQADLPKITTRVWLFGTSAGGDEARAVDVCDSFGVDTTAPPSQGSVATTAPATTVPIGTVGQELPGPDGGKVILHRVDNPAKPSRKLSADPGEGKVLVSADVEICAGRKDANGVGAASWSLKTSDNRVWPVWMDDHTNDPPLGVSQRVPAGQCVRGWVTWSIDQGATPAQVIYDLTGNGFGPFLNWNVG